MRLVPKNGAFLESLLRYVVEQSQIGGELKKPL